MYDAYAFEEMLGKELLFVADTPLFDEILEPLALGDHIVKKLLDLIFGGGIDGVAVVVAGEVLLVNIVVLGGFGLDDEFCGVDALAAGCLHALKDRIHMSLICDYILRQYYILCSDYYLYSLLASIQIMNIRQK